MPNYPALYQVNIRVTLNALARQLHRPTTLDDVTNEVIDDWAAKGFEWIWLLSVWKTGKTAQTISRTDSHWRAEFQKTLPDLVDADIGGSGFAIQEYRVSRELGGDKSLASLRERMKARGLKLMLDFVPNHMAPDHPWLEQHPDFFIKGSERDLAEHPENYTQISTDTGTGIVAMGRDPYFSGWQDTVQLNYGNLELQRAMLGELQRIAGCCDGVRCDMAMLVLPEIFHRTWGIQSAPFWPDTIRAVREHHPEFLFVAEVYWDLEWELQQQGFDYCYDKRLYDRLRGGHAISVRQHLTAGLDFQNRLTRFLENHDEPRAAHEFPLGKHRVAALITYLIPGLRLFHQGQFEGRQKRISPHLLRGPDELEDSAILAFYEKLLAILRLPIVRQGDWQLLDPKPNRDGNHSNENIIAFRWKHSDGSFLVIATNLSTTASQARIELNCDVSKNASIRFVDLLDGTVYEREGKQLVEQGLYVDLPEWGAHILISSSTAANAGLLKIPG